MPTSNGLVTARDIRQNAVKTLHILDEAVTTSKIPDLAVTFPDKIDNPIWVEVQKVAVNASSSLTSTRATMVTVQVEVPAWVDQLTLFGVGELQLTNTSGAETLMTAYVVVDGDDAAAGSHEVANNSTQRLSCAFIYSVLNAAGSTVDITVDVVVSAGTHASHNEALFVLAQGTRE